jgi:hypothetical protein
MGSVVSSSIVEVSQGRAAPPRTADRPPSSAGSGNGARRRHGLDGQLEANL